MLALTSKVGEEIYIGDDVMIRVVSVGGNSVKLAFSAPPEVKILRGELKHGTRGPVVHKLTEGES